MRMLPQHNFGALCNNLLPKPICFASFSSWTRFFRQRFICTLHSSSSPNGSGRSLCSCWCSGPSSRRRGKEHFVFENFCRLTCSSSQAFKEKESWMYGCTEVTTVRTILRICTLSKAETTGSNRLSTRRHVWIADSTQSRALTFMHVKHWGGPLPRRCGTSHWCF